MSFVLQDLRHRVVEKATVKPTILGSTYDRADAFWTDYFTRK